jgi:hypothetical protein
MNQPQSTLYAKRTTSAAADAQTTIKDADTGSSMRTNAAGKFMFRACTMFRAIPLMIKQEERQHHWKSPK